MCFYFSRSVALYFKGVPAVNDSFILLISKPCFFFTNGLDALTSGLCAL